jgi:hypothetical protein
MVEYQLASKHDVLTLNLAPSRGVGGTLGKFSLLEWKKLK